MSSLAAVFNGCSTLFTMDIYKKLHPQASEKMLVHVGRIATIVVVGLGILWIPILRGFSASLYQYLQNVQAYIGPPITAVFLLGLFWRRINGAGALTALIGGFVLGMSKLLAEVFRESTTGLLRWYADVNFLYFAPLLFLVSVVLMVVVSLASREPDPDQIRGLTYSTTLAEDRAKSRASWDWRDLVHTGIILGIIVLVMIYFSPLGVGS
jgi:SSS family solute:Na+ symporter